MPLVRSLTKLPKQVKHWVGISADASKWVKSESARLSIPVSEIFRRALDRYRGASK